MKWEYNVATGVAQPDGTIAMKWTTTKLWKFSCFVEMLNAHGDVGWELVDLEHISKKAGFICTFKRQISED